MTRYKINAQVFAEIGHPIPAMHALDTDHDIAQKRFQKLFEFSRVSRDFFMNTSLTGLIDNANVKDCTGSFPYSPSRIYG